MPEEEEAGGVELKRRVRSDGPVEGVVRGRHRTAGVDGVARLGDERQDVAAAVLVGPVRSAPVGDLALQHHEALQRTADRSENKNRNTATDRQTDTRSYTRTSDRNTNTLENANLVSYLIDRLID